MGAYRAWDQAILFLFVGVCVPLAANIGIGPKVVVILVIFAAQMGFSLPSALAPIALTYGSNRSSLGGIPALLLLIAR